MKIKSFISALLLFLSYLIDHFWGSVRGTLESSSVANQLKNDSIEYAQSALISRGAYNLPILIVEVIFVSIAILIWVPAIIKKINQTKEKKNERVS